MLNSARLSLMMIESTHFPKRWRGDWNRHNKMNQTRQYRERQCCFTRVKSFIRLKNYHLPVHVCQYSIFLYCVYSWWTWSCIPFLKCVYDVIYLHIHTLLFSVCICISSLICLSMYMWFFFYICMFYSKLQIYINVLLRCAHVKNPHFCTQHISNFIITLTQHNIFLWWE